MFLLSSVAVAADITRIIFVRHAEVDLSSASRNPNLTEAGERRAQNLAGIATEHAVEQVFATEFNRTYQTAFPTAQSFGSEVSVISAWDSDELLNEIVLHCQGKSLLVVGHSNTIPELIRALGGPEVDRISEGDFDRIFLMTIDMETTDVTLQSSNY